MVFSAGCNFFVRNWAKQLHICVLLSFQLVIGNYGMSPDQEKVQMGLWSIFASSLLMSVDLRVINDRSKALLLNKGAIAISQDVLGIPGRRVLTVSLETRYQFVSKLYYCNEVFVFSF
jgi:Alpha galactosidase A